MKTETGLEYPHPRLGARYLGVGVVSPPVCRTCCRSCPRQIDRGMGWAVGEQALVG